MLILTKALSGRQRLGRAKQESLELERGGAQGKTYFWLGLGLLLALLAQQATGWCWPWLARLQAVNAYMQFSGFALLGLILYQWRFSLLRTQGHLRKAVGLLKRHKLLGAAAPLLFFVHTQSLGYAYLQWLSLCWLSVFFTGLFNREIVHLRRPWFLPLWITAHVGLSMALLFLTAYHVYLSYAFK